MSESPNRPILFKGEVYSKPIEKTKRAIPKEPDISYSEAREIILNSIDQVEGEINGLSEEYRLPTETILSLRVSADQAEKNYYPTNVLYPARQDSELEEVGSRLTVRHASSRNKEKDVKLYERVFYVRTTETGLEAFKKKLNRRTADLTAGFMLDIRKISGLQLVDKKDRISGFEKDWQNGKVEVTLHPFSLDRSVALVHFREFLQKSNLSLEMLKIKQYDSQGITFASFPANRELVELLGDYNPLRSVHPLTFRNFNGSDAITLKKGGPKIARMASRPRVVVGVIDGGYISGNRGMDQYVEVVDSVSGPAERNAAGHGSLVTSALLFGPVNAFGNEDNLINPEICVRNFRVLNQNPTGPDLYDVIDLIEKIVPANPDIQVYNISLGPDGPIEDTDVDRFTYSLDMLSKRYNVLFCVAVGNSGNVHGYERIQSPSDLVNGLAIGAFTIVDGSRRKADYSCVGPGREGNKLKPDFLAFGGCRNNEMQLVWPGPGLTASIYGTSFAAPLASSVAGTLIGKSRGVINALTARALLVHTANLKRGTGHSNVSGHGFLPKIEEVVECAKKSYTLIFEGELEKGNYREFKIPWTNELKTGKAVFDWTLAIQSDVDPNSPEDYTTSSVELTFHPNYYRYTFSKKDVNGKFKIVKVDLEDDPDAGRAYLSKGFKKSAHPAAETTDKQLDADGVLRGNLTWDSLDTRHVSKMAKSIKDPVFQVHSLSRGHRLAAGKVRFAIALTITAEKAEFDIYSRILARYHSLVPIRMEAESNIRVS